MSDKEAVIAIIREAFGANEYPGDHLLLENAEGCEPSEEVGPFKGLDDWRRVPPDVLDTHPGALSFFSQAAFRFFLPAYLVADLQGLLRVADPMFHLTHGFSDAAVELPVKDRVFLPKIGRSALVNPKRYGATTFFDYARYRLAVFTREEAVAIAAYLICRRDADPDGPGREGIDAALDSYWLDRTRTAPPAESLGRRLAEQADFLAALRERRENRERRR